jgi:predicted nucleotidyltransferase
MVDTCSGGWTLVERKKRIPKPKEVKTRLDREKVLRIVGNFLKDHDTQPVYGCVYGSVARNQHRIESDVDVMVLYSPKPRGWRPGVVKNRRTGRIYLTAAIIEEMKTDLQDLIGCKVDVRCYTVRDQIVYVPENSEYFAQCVQTDCVQVHNTSKMDPDKDFYKRCSIVTYVDD